MLIKLKLEADVLEKIGISDVSKMEGCYKKKNCKIIVNKNELGGVTIGMIFDADAADDDERITELLTVINKFF